MAPEILVRDLSYNSECHIGGVFWHFLYNDNQMGIKYMVTFDKPTERYPYSNNYYMQEVLWLQRFTKTSLDKCVNRYMEQTYVA